MRRRGAEQSVSFVECVCVSVGVVGGSGLLRNFLCFISLFMDGSWGVGGGVDKSLFFYLFLFSKSRSRELLTPSLPQPVRVPG